MKKLKPHVTSNLHASTVTLFHRLDAHRCPQCREIAFLPHACPPQRLLAELQGKAPLTKLGWFALGGAGAMGLVLAAQGRQGGAISG